MHATIYGRGQMVIPAQARKKARIGQICQVGFLRISTHPRVYNLAMNLAEEALRDFTAKNRAEFIPDDLSAARLGATSSDAVTDFYLAGLAHAHQLKLATFDTRIVHAAVE